MTQNDSKLTEIFLIPEEGCFWACFMVHFIDKLFTAISTERQFLQTVFGSSSLLSTCKKGNNVIKIETPH